MCTVEVESQKLGVHSTRWAITGGCPIARQASYGDETLKDIERLICSIPDGAVQDT